MPKAAKTKIAVFDIDGTIFRSSLVIELTQALIKYGIFPPIAEKEIENSFYRWKNRRGSYENYINQVVNVFSRRVKRCFQKDIVTTSRLVIKEQKNAVYVYTRELIKKMKKEGYLLLAVSGSPIEIVKIFGRSWHFDYVLGTVFETKNGFYTGAVLSLPSVNKKETLLNFAKEHKLSLKNSIGVGDTESDIGFLEIVKKPICFNPNRKLYLAAKKQRWPVIVERKDMIYHVR